MTFVSFTGRGVIADIPFADEDIFDHDTRTGAWKLVFDGPDVELTATSENVIGVSRSEDSQTLDGTSLGPRWGRASPATSEVRVPIFWLVLQTIFRKATLCTVNRFYNGASQGIQAIDRCDSCQSTCGCLLRFPATHSHYRLLAILKPTEISWPPP
ncbi:hypothetical protein [Novipirellula sp.]|uniref:hypothetical protein n=1 Tax=Novipirellula sp. TaxID=2795430 RepID=UPI003569E5F6